MVLWCADVAEMGSISPSWSGRRWVGDERVVRDGAEMGSVSAMDVGRNEITGELF